MKRIFARLFIFMALLLTLVAPLTVNALGEYTTWLTGHSRFAYNHRYELGSVSNFSNNAMIAQTFIAEGAQVITHVDGLFYRRGTANGSLSALIYAAAANHTPVGSPIWQGTYSASNITEVSGVPTASDDNPTLVRVQVTGAPGAVTTPGSRYILVWWYPGGQAPPFSDMQMYAAQTSWQPDYYEGQAMWQGFDNLWYSRTDDLYFTIWGHHHDYGGEQIIVTTGNASYIETIGGNYTVYVPVDVTPDYVTQNVTLELANNTFFASPLTVYEFGHKRVDQNTFRTIFSDTDFGAGAMGQLLPNTIYYYRGAATINGTTYYGQSKATVTIPLDIPDPPSVAMVSVVDETPNDSSDRIFTMTGLYVETTVNGTVTTSPVITRGFQMSNETDGFGELLSPIRSFSAHETTDDNNFSRTVDLDDYITDDWYLGGVVHIQAFVNTPDHGFVMSKTVHYDPTDDTVVGSDISQSNFRTVWGLIEDSLKGNGWFNETGKMLIILICLLVSIVATQGNKILGFAIPTIILIIGIVTSWLPPFISVLIGLVCAWLVFKGVTGHHSDS